MDPARQAYLNAMGIQTFRRQGRRLPPVQVARFPGCLLFFPDQTEDPMQQKLLLNLGNAVQRALGQNATQPEFLSLTQLAAETVDEDCQLALFCGLAEEGLAAAEALLQVPAIRSCSLQELIGQPEAKADLWRALQQALGSASPSSQPH